MREILLILAEWLWRADEISENRVVLIVVTVAAVSMATCDTGKPGLFPAICFLLVSDVHRIDSLLRRARDRDR